MKLVGLFIYSLGLFIPLYEAYTMSQMKRLLLHIEDLQEEKRLLENRLLPEEKKAWRAYAQDSLDESADQVTNLRFQIQELKAFLSDRTKDK